ncbi:hypothetical protein [Zooshikella ganghwensis]|uniref:Uncharacterized protein n=1 Tax=Zooshikella ganghwensis TaxID=202772 RepID=A0A4P9VQS7_9GAMM|nr:hypothetical protein [Zooshikella ganghwensis]RDH44724.1 hypothetical protein B9G39_15490 [Zooshikella ganghwensis]
MAVLKSVCAAFMLSSVVLSSMVCMAQEAENTTSIEEVKQESQEALRAVKNYSVEKRDQAMAKVSSALDKVDMRIHEMQEDIDKNWDQMSEATRAKTRFALNELHKQRNELAEWYGGMKNSTADAWDEMKQGFSNAFSSFQQAWDNAKSEFKGTEKE